MEAQSPKSKERLRKAQLSIYGGTGHRQDYEAWQPQIEGHLIQSRLSPFDVLIRTCDRSVEPDGPYLWINGLEVEVYVEYLGRCGIEVEGMEKVHGSRVQ